MDIDTVIAFWVKWCLPSFVIVMLGIGYVGAGMVENDAQIRVATACQQVRTGVAGVTATVTITRGKTSRKFKC